MRCACRERTGVTSECTNPFAQGGTYTSGHVDQKVKPPSSFLLAYLRSKRVLRADNAALVAMTRFLPSHLVSCQSLTPLLQGTTLAVGTISGRLHIYDASTLQLTRTYERAHTQRIGALSWNSHILSSGSRDRMVHHRDVREAAPRPFKRCQGHRQEVCGLRWSGDGGPQAATLASGGNDNKVCIWDLRGSKRSGGLGTTPGRVGNVPGNPSAAGGTSTDDGDAPLWKFHEHTAAVKALAWDPHVSGILATGGGTADKHIRFWNVQTGTMLNELDTGSQVSHHHYLQCRTKTQFLFLL